MSNTLTDTSKNWIDNEWVGGTVRIVSGTGAGQIRGIVSNTSDTLTVDAEWETEPAAFSYQISLSYISGVVAGQGGTTAQPHPAGSLVVQPVVNGGYLFIAAAHASKAITRVKVDGVIQAGGYTTNLDDTSTMTGRHLTTISIPVLPGTNPGSTGGGAGGPKLGTARAIGVVSPLFASADPPPWLTGAVGWRATVSLSVVIDTSVGGLQPSSEFSVNRVLVVLTYPGGSIEVVQAQTDATGHITVTSAITSFSTGARGGGTVSFGLGAGAVGQQGGGIDTSGTLFLRPAGNPSGTTAIGSCVFTGLEVEYDYLPEHVNSAALPVTTPPGTTGVITTATQAIFDALKNVTVTCDIQGIMDDDAGTITGTPNALIELPGDIDKHLLTVYCGASSSIFDTSSYAYARSRHVELGYQHNLVINSKQTLADILSDSARQSRCWVFSDGVHVSRVFLDAIPTISMYIGLNQFLGGPPMFGETLRAFIKTSRTMKYSYRWGPGSFLLVEESTLTGDIYDENLQAIDEDKMVPGLPVMARDLLSYRLGFFRRQRRTLKGKLVWTAAPLDVGDVISLTFDAASIGDDGRRTWDDGGGAAWDQVDGPTWDAATEGDITLYSVWGGLRFRVHRSVLDIKTNTLDIEAIEV